MVCVELFAGINLGFQGEGRVCSLCWVSVVSVVA